MKLTRYRLVFALTVSVLIASCALLVNTHLTTFMSYLSPTTAELVSTEKKLRNNAKVETGTGAASPNFTSLSERLTSIYAQLSPAIAELVSAERKLRSDANAKAASPRPGVRLPKTHLDTAADDYLQQSRVRMHNSKTVVFSVPRSTFLSILSKTVYAVRSNNCWALSHNVIIFRNMYGMPCLVIANTTTTSTSATTTTITTTAAAPGELHGARRMADLEAGYNQVTGQFATRSQTGTSPRTTELPPTPQPGPGPGPGPGQPTGRVSLGYVQVLRDALLMSNGDVLTNGSYINIIRCVPEIRDNFNASSVPSYDRVFTIAQYYGQNYYHLLSENLPRLALSLPLLKRDSDIRVHVAQKNTITSLMLAELGISADRLVSGVVRARVAYVPAGSTCGRISVVPGNLLALLLRSRLIPPILPPPSPTQPPPPPRYQLQFAQDTIVLIKRSAKRWFDNHSQILTMLRIVARESRLRVEVFPDNPVPPLSVMQVMFDRALLVVGPHGAGMSNLLFSQPGTCVIEVLCYSPLRQMNVCYKHSSENLGHIYYGIVPRVHCRKTTSDDLLPSIKHCLQTLHR